MANDLFGGLGALGGLMDGLAKSGLVPKDTPEGQLLNASSEVSDLQKQESDLLLEIGRAAYEENPGKWPQDGKLQLIRQNLATAQGALDAAQKAQEDAQAAQAAEDAKGRCPSCGYKNADGVKFCQECGTSLVVVTKHCTACGAELAPGTRFCGSCGAAQETSVGA